MKDPARSVSHVCERESPPANYFTKFEEGADLRPFVTTRSVFQQFCPHASTFRGWSSFACLAVLAIVPAAPVRAQDAAAAPAQTAPIPAVAPPAVNFRERPRYPTEVQRLRRTPVIDGQLTDGEWDPFYTVADGAIKGTVYCNWDENNLYLAARTDQAATVIFDVDAGGDGWLRGADNIEIVVGPAQDGSQPTLTARLLDAASNKDAPSWNDKVIDPKQITLSEKMTNGTQVLELSIPRNVASLVLRPGAQIGLRGDFLPPAPAASFAPTQPFEPHLLLDARLVDSRAESVAGVNPRLTLSDYKCIAGQTLFATFELRNQNDQVVPIKSMTWTGQGASVDVLNTLREVNVESIPSLGSRKLTYRTVLPAGAVPGAYTLVARAMMPDAKQVESTVSFSVVEPLQVQISSDPQPVAIIGSTRLGVDVDVVSAVPNHFSGDAEITSMPAGWELEGPRKRRVDIDREDGRKVTRFAFKLPSTTPAGDYPVQVLLTWHGRQWPLKQTVQVIRTDAPKPVAPAARP